MIFVVYPWEDSCTILPDGHGVARKDEGVRRRGFHAVPLDCGAPAAGSIRRASVALGARQPALPELPQAVSTGSQAPRAWTWLLILGAPVNDNGLARHASSPSLASLPRENLARPREVSGSNARGDDS
jgi:hypothetical protein